MELDDDGLKEHTGQRWVHPDSKELVCLLSAALWVDAVLFPNSHGLEDNIRYAEENGYK
jgi:hypothetical protein